MNEGPINLADFATMDVDRLVGVGPKKAKGLREFGIATLKDLLTHYPRRYIDRRREATIAELDEDTDSMVMIQIDSVTSRKMRNRRTMVIVDGSDHTGRLRLTFFNQPWRAKQLHEGATVVVYGKAEMYRGSLQMTNPIVDLVGDQTGRIVPVYAQSDKAGVTTLDINKWVRETLRRSSSRGLAEPLPDWLRKQHSLVGREQALRSIHEPESMAEVTDARSRLVFDELLRLQLALVERKLEIEASEIGVTHRLTGDLLDRFVGGLPYALTGAQERTINEITADLLRSVPMHRLLQGDVGSGKTVVAVATLLAAREGGHQGALMAPTEVLAEQHYLGIRDLLSGLVVDATEQNSLFPERPLAVALLTHRASKIERTRVAEGLADGSIDILIGTHALIEDHVAFRSLGVVVIDEQHRFGVEQRAALREKGADGTVPDVLVMTATPIPRTAAMTVYGDLDVSVLDELPPGRTPISTEWIRTAVDEDSVTAAIDDAQALGPLWVKVATVIDNGQQAYVVCPLIEDSDKLEAASAEETYSYLANEVFPDRSVALLHGRLPADDKELVMAAFRRGDIDVLVATTVIEVGVDVPNATVMVILDADRFGIAQLHQLRGRVGRGGGESWCYLVGAGATEIGEARLDALVASTDGFELAEIDLDLRGEGTIMGERQKGRSDLKLASLRRDRYWVEQARQAAFTILERGDGLDALPDLKAEVEALVGRDDGDYLLKS